MLELGIEEMMKTLGIVALDSEKTQTGLEIVNQVIKKPLILQE